MEGLGIAANVIAVVDLAAKACGAVYKYAKSAKGCPKTVAQLQKELESVQKSLDGLHSIADKLEAAVPSGEQSPRISQLSGALRECQTTLGALIEDLEGHFRNKFREKLGWQLKWPMKEPEVMEFIKRLHRYQQIFLQALQADLAVVALRTEVAVQGAVVEIQGVRSEQLKDIQDRTLEGKREKLSQLVKWLAPLHYNTKHEDSFEKHQEGTSVWLFDNHKFREWESSSPSILWIHGIPGCGKTILASCVIEQQQNNLPQECGFAYFYCQYSREETGKPTNIVKTLLAQLLLGLDCDEIEKAPTGGLFAKMEKGHGPPEDMKRLTELAVAVVTLYRRSTIVIDGLDECPLDRRRPLLDFITHLPHLSNTSILVMSRKEIDIEDELGTFPTLSLEDEQVNLKEDMQKHIEQEFKDTKKWGQSFQALQEEIIESLILGSGKNMFRWLECQLVLLNRLHTPKAIREALANLPLTLFKTYDRMLGLIEEEQAGELAIKAFFLVAHARKQLRLEALVEAIASADHNNRLDWSTTFVNPRKLLGVCRALLYSKKMSGSETGSRTEKPEANVNPQSELIDFCHYTVLEYLVSDYLRKHPKLSEYAIEPKNSDQAAVKIATLTFKYLLLEDFSQPCSSDGELAQRLGKFRFYRHCAFHWVNYLAQANDDIPLFELVDRFIFDSPRSLRSYQQMAYERIDELDELQILYKDKFDRNYELSSALFLLLIKQDITWVVRRILERRPQLLNADVCNFGPPLRIAILGSCYDLANEILTMGADIHMQCRNLLPTDYFGKFGVEEFGVDECRERCIPGTLVGEGRILRVPKNVRMEYIIHTAAQFTPMLLPHFLNSSVDVNIRTEDGASPIHYAVLGNNLEAVEALVNAGAEINAEINGGRTAFHIAISINSPTILLYLLDSNAAVPPDITATEVHTVINSAGRSYLGEKQRERRKSAQKGLSKRLSMIPKERRDCPDISCNWVRSGASRKELRHADGPNTNADLYLSFEFQGTSLKRVQFRLYSRYMVKRSFTSFGLDPYRESYSWLEAAIIKSSTLAKSGTSGTMPTGLSLVLPRCIQRNVNDAVDGPVLYHSVTWDVRDPTLGIKGWLESVQTGDMIVVYPNAAEVGYGTELHAVEMDVYWES